MTNKGYATGQQHWIYPSDTPAPHGVKLSLLTRGGVQITGQWRDGGDFIAWQYLFRRDRAKEAVK